jgi:hypothetical protein
MKRQILTVFAAALVSGCAVFQGTQPAGFAPWKDNDGRRHRAASPDGVVWEIRSEKHDPVAGLDFWKRALRDRLGGRGYKIVDSVAFSMDGHPAFALEAGQDDQSWLVAIAPLAERIVVVEVEGPLQAYQKRRADILAALPRIKPVSK